MTVCRVRIGQVFERNRRRLENQRSNADSTLFVANAKMGLERPTMLGDERRETLDPHLRVKKQRAT